MKDREDDKEDFKSTMLVCCSGSGCGTGVCAGSSLPEFWRTDAGGTGKGSRLSGVCVEHQGASYLENVTDKGSRITYIDQDGTILYDSEADASEMENHGDRVEFQKAEKYGAGESSRYSDTLSVKTIYYAVRLADGKVLRVSGTQDTVIALVGKLVLPLCWVLFLMLIFSGVMASLISKKI